VSSYSKKSCIREILIKRDGEKCAYCNSLEKDLTIDHIIPTSKKGSRYGRYNLVLACQLCNCKKGNTKIQSFLNKNNIGARNKTILKQIERIRRAKNEGREVKEVIIEEIRKNKSMGLQRCAL